MRLGGPKVRKARRNFADPLEGGDVSFFMMSLLLLRLLSGVG